MSIRISIFHVSSTITIHNCDIIFESITVHETIDHPVDALTSHNHHTSLPYHEFLRTI